jgi:hypothetical protein
MSPTAEVDAWLYATLTGDVALMAMVKGVWNTKAVPESATPLVVYAQEGLPRASRSLSDELTMVEMRYRVTVVGAGGSTSALKPIMDRLHTLLNKQAVNGTGYKLNVATDGVFEQADILLGTTRYSQLGAIYRVRYRPVG